MFVFTTEVSKLYTEALTNPTAVWERNAAHVRAAVQFSLFSAQLGTTDNSNALPFVRAFETTMALFLECLAATDQVDLQFE